MSLYHQRRQHAPARPLSVLKGCADRKLKDVSMFHVASL